ncbi:MAG TPA: adenine phosphoribosyltransferase [Gemmatimonadales bacterium]|nr:adenine phosphoribosyltransferase [Gemmatimonadales bacterium]
MLDVALLREAIRDVPDFPKPGIIFKDITPVLLDPRLFGLVARSMAQPYEAAGVTRVVAIESRGFMFGAPVALDLGAGLVPVRKPGKLPSVRQRVEYALEYGTDALEMHADAIGASDRVLIVDDVLATGGTAEAAGRLVRARGATIAGYSFLIELEFLNGRERLAAARVESLVRY